MQKMKISQFYATILSFLIILSTNSVYLWAEETDFHLSEITIILTILYSIYICSLKKLKTKHIKITISSLILFLFVSVVYLFIGVPSSQIFGYIIRFIIFVPLVFLASLVSNEDFRSSTLLKSYSRLMLIMCIISLFFWLFGSILNVIAPTGLINVGWVSQGNLTNYYRSYFGLYCDLQKINVLGISIYRNCSIFCEAPMYSITIVLALLFELFCNEKKNIVAIVIMLLTIITTFSTTAILCALLALFLYYYKDFFIHKRKLRYYFLPISALIVVSLGLFLFNLKSDTNSWIVRSRSWVSCWQVFMNNPLAGAGYLNMNDVFAYSKAVYGDSTDISNSLGSILAQGGICLGFLYFFVYIKCIYLSIKHKDLKSLAFITVFLIAFSFTSATNSYIVLMVNSLLYVYVSKTEKRWIS